MSTVVLFAMHSHGASVLLYFIFMESEKCLRQIIFKNFGRNQCTDSSPKCNWINSINKDAIVLKLKRTIKSILHCTSILYLKQGIG